MACHTGPVNQWGPSGYGDPCGACGFDWSITETGAAGVIAGAPGRFGALLAGRDGTGRAPGLAWDAREYVWHVADNLRIWEERLSALTPGATLPVAPYDQDRLAEARGYGRMPLTSARWSLGQSSAQWTALWPSVPGDGRLLHPESGVMEVGQVLRQVAHDTFHHQHDVERSV